MPPPRKKQRVERWSRGVYNNPVLPNYVPPEMIIHDSGRTLEALLIRAAFDDIRRLCEHEQYDVYFQRQRPNHIKPEYDRQGNRTNTPKDILNNRRMQLLEQIVAKGKEQHTLSSGVTELAGKGNREILHKIYLTPEQIESRAYGAIIGARGRTHQELEKEYRCRIVVEGRGITDLKKEVNMQNSAALTRAEEAPHVRITARDERDMRRCIEKISWILSDDPEAQEFREENRKALAIVNGTYNPDTWVSSIKPEAGAGAGKKGHVKDDDDLVNDLLS